MSLSQIFGGSVFLSSHVFGEVRERSVNPDTSFSIADIASKDQEAFYQEHYGKLRIEKMSLEKVQGMPEQARLLDAQIYARKIFSNEPEQAAQLADLMKSDPKLHWFLRQNRFHAVMSKFPTPPFILDENGIQFNYNGEQVSWNTFKQQLGSTIILWKGGEMKNAWIGYDGIKTAPTPDEVKTLREKAETLQDKEAFLELMQKGFVKAEVVSNKEDIQFPYITILVDTPTDKPSQTHVHGYFAINIPDDRGNIHRFVMGKERKAFGWKAQRGRLSLLDVRHHRHFSSNQDPVKVDFRIPQDKMQELFGSLLDEVSKSEIYGQHRFNCCSLQEKLLNILGIRWDTKMHPLSYVSEKLVPTKGSTAEKVVNTMLNVYFVLSGAADVSVEARELFGNKKVFKHEEVLGIPSFSQLTNPALTYIDSPFQSGRLCLEMQNYRDAFVSEFETAARELKVEEEKIQQASKEIARAGKFLIPADTDGVKDFIDLILDKFKSILKSNE